MKKAEYRFKYLRRLLKSNDDIKEYCNGFYFNKKALDYIFKIMRSFHINKAYDLTVDDILNYILYNKCIEDVRNDLYYNYNTCFASSWFDNFIYILSA